MGLFQKAASIVPGQGLLQKSIEMIVEKRTELPPYLTQGEIDGLLRTRKPHSVSIKKSENPIPPRVPRTWIEAGIEAPPLRGPHIDGTEFTKNNPRKSKAAKASAAADPTDGIISAVFALPQSVEHPSEAFGILKERLSISKGALLLFDPVRMVYAPWAGVGYDTTTLHRLRIPLGASESFNAAANGRPIIVSGTSELARYNGFFSNREFASVSWLILVPFIYGDKLIAILVISAAAPPYATQEQFLMGLERIAGAASPAFQKAREERLRETEDREDTRPKTLEEELARFLASRAAAGKRILFFSLSLEAMEKKILTAIPLLDSFRLQEDIRYFLHNFTADVGRLISMGRSNFLFAIYGLEKENVDLFLHQLRVFLGGLFGRLDGALDSLTASAINRSHMYPDDGDGVPHLVSLFSA
jgi:hypothetical protein